MLYDTEKDMRNKIASRHIEGNDRQRHPSTLQPRSERGQEGVPHIKEPSTAALHELVHYGVLLSRLLQGTDGCQAGEAVLQDGQIQLLQEGQKPVPRLH